MQTGWAKVGGAWYYLSGSGAMQTGWLKLGGTWYWLDPESGAMATGWAKAADGKWYYFEGSGAMRSGGWMKQGSSWYYLSGSGAMQTGWLSKGADASMWSAAAHWCGTVCLPRCLKPHMRIMASASTPSWPASMVCWTASCWITARDCLLRADVA